MADAVDQFLQGHQGKPVPLQDVAAFIRQQYTKAPKDADDFQLVYSWVNRPDIKSRPGINSFQLDPGSLEKYQNELKSTGVGTRQPASTSAPSLAPTPASPPKAAAIPQSSPAAPASPPRSKQADATLGLMGEVFRDARQAFGRSSKEEQYFKDHPKDDRQFLTPAAIDYLTKNPTKRADVPGTEEFKAKREQPLVPFSKLAPNPAKAKSNYGKVATGEIKGALEGLEGMTTPESLQWFAAALASGGSTTAESTIGEVATYLLRKGAPAFFRLGAGKDIWDNMPGLKDAYDKRDYGEMGRIMGKDLFDLFVATSIGKGKERTKGTPTRAQVENALSDAEAPPKAEPEQAAAPTPEAPPKAEPAPQAAPTGSTNLGKGPKPAKEAAPVPEAVAASPEKTEQELRDKAIKARVDKAQKPAPKLTANPVPADTPKPIEERVKEVQAPAKAKFQKQAAAAKADIEKQVEEAKTRSREGVEEKGQARLAQTEAMIDAAKPRYNYGQHSFDPEFESPLDKAAYIIANPEAKSAEDATFLKYVMDQTGMTEVQARGAGERIRSIIKEQAKRNVPLAGAPGSKEIWVQKTTQAKGEKPARAEPAPAKPAAKPVSATQELTQPGGTPRQTEAARPASQKESVQAKYRKAHDEIQEQLRGIKGVEKLGVPQPIKKLGRYAGQETEHKINGKNKIGLSWKIKTDDTTYFTPYDEPDNHYPISKRVGNVDVPINWMAKGASTPATTAPAPETAAPSPPAPNAGKPGAIVNRAAADALGLSTDTTYEFVGSSRKGWVTLRDAEGGKIDVNATPVELKQVFGTDITAPPAPPGGTSRAAVLAADQKLAVIGKNNSYPATITVRDANENVLHSVTINNAQEFAEQRAKLAQDIEKHIDKAAAIDLEMAGLKGRERSVVENFKRQAEIESKQTPEQRAVNKKRKERAGLIQFSTLSPPQEATA